MAALTSSPPPMPDDVSAIQYASNPSLKPESPLDLRTAPPILVLNTHLNAEEVHAIEDRLRKCGATVTYDCAEAKIVLGKITSKKRALLELRTRKILTEEISNVTDYAVVPPPAKQIKINDSRSEPKVNSRHTFSRRKSSESETESEYSTASETSPPHHRRPTPSKAKLVALQDSSTESEVDLSDSGRKAKKTLKRKRDASATPASSPPPTGPPILDPLLEQDGVVCVIRMQWLDDSIAAGAPKNISDYSVLIARRIASSLANNTQASQNATVANSNIAGPLNIKGMTSMQPGKPRFLSRQSILQRARAEADIAAGTSSSQHLAAPYGERKFQDHGRNRSAGTTDRPSQSQTLLQHNTSSYEGTNESEVPPPPEWVKKSIKYACQRITPADSPNNSFIDQLEKIKLARLLTGDEIGVRAYSTSIASLRAYPYKISTAKEILQLPGCDAKIANLWIEWRNSGNGQIKAATEAENDESLKILRDFYGIWGVGAKTAREFLYERGWRDRDDVVEYGWSTLSRVQQIGVKYYEEFLEGIPRGEVERIAAKVREHAVRVRDEGIEVLVVGGYRRGKKLSGDVDIIVSHRQLHSTAGLVEDITKSLETEGWVTHTLTLALTTTERQQSTLPFKVAGTSSHGPGFDTLDKALVVWQDLKYDKTVHEKNSNPHRRVDVIVSPWRTVGCAVLGWSGGTTFQRDIRRYCSVVKNWKFDSSGIRDRTTGEVVRLEGMEGVDGDMIDAEKKVFEGLGLDYREPGERCTG